MATVYRAPIDPPKLTLDGMRPPAGGTIEDAPYFVETRAYTEKLATMARDLAKRELRPATLVGEIVRFPVADGYAEYMVWRQKPLQLIHLDLMDGWHAHSALIRGLRVTDVKAQVEADKRLAALFAAKKENV